MMGNPCLAHPLSCYQYRGGNIGIISQEPSYKQATIRETVTNYHSKLSRVEDIEKQLSTMNIKEEEEITVCELFDQYERKGRREGIREGITQGIQVLILTCRDMKLSFAETAERVKKGFQLDDTELQRNMELYWPK